MSKLRFSTMKSLDQLRSMSGASKTYQMSSRSSSDSISLGSFANLKLTAEKLVKEQASVKTDLEMANTKLKKSVDQIHFLEEKLQNAINDNAKLKVKQKEDAKLWKGLESKFSSTKTLCDQLTETLQQLAGQVRDAEQDKRVFEDRLCASLKTFETLHLQMTSLSMKLESTEENIRNSEQEMIELRTEKEEKEKTFVDENRRVVNLIGEKNATIKDLEGTIASDKSSLESLGSRLKEVQHELYLREDICKCLKATQENLEKEKSALQSSNEDYAKRLLASGQEIQRLEDFVQWLVEKLVELDKNSVVFSNNVAQMTSAFDNFYKLVQEEKEFTAKIAQRQYGLLQDQFLRIKSENEAFQTENGGLKNKIIELQKVQEGVMVQHAEGCRLTEEKIQGIESEAETLLSKKKELEMLVSTLEEKSRHLSEVSSISKTKMQELLLKVSTLESENLDTQDKMQVKLQGKSEEVEALQKEIVRHGEHINLLEKQVSQLHESLEEKEQLHMQFTEREKQLEQQRIEVQTSLAAAETTLMETKKQYDLMLESKQLELTKHIKEISQRNDQAINDIRRKFELEKLEIVNLEKEKAEKVVGEMERKCDQKLVENKEESRQCLVRVQAEHASLISNLRKDHDKKESNLRADHEEEQKQLQLQAEEDLEEKTMMLKQEHDVQIRDLKRQHDDEYRKLQEELDLQRSKEERQRKLLKMQWKVMDGHPQEDQEVTSKKAYSVSKRSDTDGEKQRRLTVMKPQKEEKVINRTDSPYLIGTQTPVASIMKKVEKGNPGSVTSMPKHSRKVTHREYEVETTNGRTITKRKTKSTVMFDDPKKQKRTPTPKAKNVKDVVKVVKGGGLPRPSNIGDLFSEGSLNPYADDPYAFD
ncbi:hypothetical protein GIB67_019348 [Kingdonia uniflora]|uniref:Synaptonemal complex protein 1 n=1 Tax=Kingdonia uniflora TaxID=39325 RepID=A0A7J7M1Q5_9MAGN|nr:hypothetical protein GIB67_019348 [Kingdonia uniflora]